MSSKEEDLVFGATFGQPIEFQDFELEISPPFRRVVLKPKPRRNLLEETNGCQDGLAIEPSRNVSGGVESKLKESTHTADRFMHCSGIVLEKKTCNNLKSI